MRFSTFEFVNHLYFSDTKATEVLCNMTANSLSECLDKIAGCINELEERQEEEVGFICSGGRDHTERQHQQCMFKALGLDDLFSVSHTGRGLIASKFGTADQRQAMIFVQTNCM